MITVTVPYIQSDEDHQTALARIEELWNAEEGTPEHAEVEVLTTLVESYERKRYPIDPPTPKAVVQGLMDRLELSQTDLVPIFGSSSRVSEFLNGKRKLSKEQAVRLHVRYGLPLELLFNVHDLVAEFEQEKAAPVPKTKPNRKKAA